MFKQAVYNADLTECLEIGYFENWKGEIQIEQFLPTTKKVPKVLPKEITSLELAFHRNENAYIDGVEYWNTKNITDMNYMFFEAENFNQNISTWDASNVIDMTEMFAGASKFNQDLSKWDTSNVNVFGQNIGASNPNWKPEHRPKFNKTIGKFNCLK
ncbi:BspA family leucine-rich repeat surface protein [Mycoplasma capricolum subsp. capripneumoniae]|uniref:BspA family leucine-rich repeat surface protein n=1 Tax=Mycoplasma capricolum TaxID=2095 RepID=UPI001404582B|nr:BspA family leucine-rich repeat surface protein [Mycoplasma capricolum]QIN43660.1 BspA family leucine-rich repeat surface protein [Mycoplasma capricolum subsp. capripneumoniae]